MDKMQLSGRWPDGEKFTAVLIRDHFMVGRHPKADFVVPPSAPFISGRHFEIALSEDGWTVVDLHSTNGTRLNGVLLTPEQPHALFPGDLIRIGTDELSLSVGFLFGEEGSEPKTVLSRRVISSTSITNAHKATIGRDPNCQIVLDSPSVGMLHATLHRMDADHTILQAHGSYRVIINGQTSERALLNPGDHVQIGVFEFQFDGQSLVQYASRGFRVDVLNLSKQVSAKTGEFTILDNINFTVLPREFVAIVGGSGAGKSTLLDALNGSRPAQGQVLINGVDLYANYDEFRRQIGYVPQTDILPTSLTVESALRYSARLRLPPDTSRQEIEARIQEALETVEMSGQRLRTTRISKLSGGQRKRVSIAAELLADPRLFFLDEPASGLDPGLEKKLMYTLRKMADEGRTIILITHATDNILQADHVAFLSQGKLVYFGPPEEALTFFEVRQFADIYEVTDKKGAEWRSIFTQARPNAYQEYIIKRQQSSSQARQHDKSGRLSFGEVSLLGIRQFIVLCQRMAHLTLLDPIALFAALLVMPFTAILMGLAATPHAIVGDPAVLANAAGAAEIFTENYFPATDSHIFLFGIAILCFLVGAFGGSQELIKERSIYLRERMINLQLPAYIGSKFFVFSAFAVVQCTLYLLVLGLLQVKFPVQGVMLPGPIELILTMFLTVLAGIATGLFISSLSPNSTVAMYLVLIFVFFQYIFGGAIYNLRGKTIEFQSFIAATRWSTLAMGATADVAGLTEYTIVCGNDFALDTSHLVIDPTTGTPDFDTLQVIETSETRCTNRPVAVEDLFLPYSSEVKDFLTFWGWLIGLTFLFAAATVILVRMLK